MLQTFKNKIAKARQLLITLNQLNKTTSKRTIDMFSKFSGISVAPDIFTDDYFSFDHFGKEFKLTIQDKVYFRRYCHILMYPNACLTIHRNVFFNNYCSINCLGVIEIGENTLFGESVKLYDHNHSYRYIDNLLDVDRNNFSIGKIRIGKNCWIGSNVTILKDVVIGDNVIVGANCLVYKNIASNSIIKFNSSV